ncbi:hypothetical protein NQZ68_007121 [Dissostichus eleginoides]|nr:hypothetical protein NQZ68_007121 [Dissostichus eleginoides]
MPGLGQLSPSLSPPPVPCLRISRLAAQPLGSVRHPAPPQPRQIKPYLAQPEHSAVNKRSVINTLTDRLIMMAESRIVVTACSTQYPAIGYCHLAWHHAYSKRSRT